MKPPKRYIRDILLEALRRRGFDESEATRVAVSLPRNPRWGDYSTNSAFLLAGVSGKTAQEMAGYIAEAIPKEMFERVEVAAGFINFTLSRQFLFAFLREARRSGPGYGKTELGKGKSILIEFVSANPTGPLVVANARAAATGDSLVRIFRHCGYNAQSEFYVDD
ncbi:MAG: arginine--tRNA ligase, partial [bacterium]